MKKIKWNTIIFLCYLAYCLLFFVLFWVVFTDNDLFYKYFDMAFNCLLIISVANTISQIIGAITKQYFAIRWLLLGGLLFFLTIGFTVGQSV